MPDPKEKPLNLGCYAGEDPSNPRTKGAVVTIWDLDTKTSLYHLSPKDAQTGAIESAMESLGMLKKADAHGAFRYSQAPGTPNRDPLHLQAGINTIQANFSGGKLTGCAVDSGNDPDSSLQIKAVDKLPNAAPQANPRVTAPAPATP
jgi:hypothetical protein